MSADKKRIRQQFRDAVFKRDGHRCRACGWSLFKDDLQLDAHHITDRNEMPKRHLVVSVVPSEGRGLPQPGHSASGLVT